jgi:hypothetical protein
MCKSSTWLEELEKTMRLGEEIEKKQSDNSIGKVEIG